MDRDGAHIPYVDSGPYPIRAGNRVRPLIDGEPAFRRICEAVESARHSVYVTIAFINPAFEMPDGRGSLFDVLDAAVERGLDVRALFWRCPLLHEHDPAAHFPGDAEQRAMLEARGSRFQARWDQAAKLYCQHQKSWLVDAGRPGEIAFVGGINLHRKSMVSPGHAVNAMGASTHDVYVELEGPSACDVHHNFVQRWNEASDRDAEDGLWPDARSQSALSFPEKPGPPAGVVAVQIQRTVRRGQYTDGTAAPGAEPFDIQGGDYSIRDQYLAAVAAAERSIYFEDQALGAPELIEALHAALHRGVEVVFLAPADPESQMAAARSDPNSREFWERFEALGEHEHFTLVGIAANGAEPGAYQNAYVHAKIALIDDVWATIGSTNIGNRSFYGDTELNASFWHRETVTALRRELLLEHLGEDTAALDDLQALRLYATIARANAARHERGERLEGLAFALSPKTYAL